MRGHPWVVVLGALLVSPVLVSQLGCDTEELLVGRFREAQPTPTLEPTLEPMWEHGPGRLDDLLSFGARPAMVYADDEGHFISLVDLDTGTEDTFKVSEPLDTLRGSVQPLDNDRYRYVWQNHYRRADWSAYSSEQRLDQAVDVRSALLLSSEVGEAIGPQIAPHPLGSLVAFRSLAGVSLRFVGFDGTYRVVSDFFPGHQLGFTDRLIAEMDQAWLVTRAQGMSRLHRIDTVSGSAFEQAIGAPNSADVSLSNQGPLLAVSTSTETTLSLLGERSPMQLERVSNLRLFSGPMRLLRMAVDDQGWVVAASAVGTQDVYVASGTSPEDLRCAGKVDVLASELFVISHAGQRLLAVQEDDEALRLFSIGCGP